MRAPSSLHHPACLRPGCGSDRLAASAARAWSSGRAAGVSRSSSMAARKRSRCSATPSGKRRRVGQRRAAARSPPPGGRPGAAARRRGLRLPARSRRTRPRRGSDARPGSGGSRRRGRRPAGRARAPGCRATCSSSRRRSAACRRASTIHEGLLAGGASDWAISDSWCGKARSAPPPWISKRGRGTRCSWPSTRCASRAGPAPQGDGHDGSSGSRWLPQHEVERVALAGQVRHIAALVGDRQHRLARQAGQLAVGRATSRRRSRRSPRPGRRGRAPAAERSAPASGRCAGWRAGRGPAAAS